MFTIVIRYFLFTIVNYSFYEVPRINGFICNINIDNIVALKFRCPFVILRSIVWFILLS